MIRAVIFDLGHTLWDFNFEVSTRATTLDDAYERARATLAARLGDDAVPPADALKRAVGEALRADSETYFGLSDRLDQPPTWTWVDRGFRSIGFVVDEPLLREVTPPLFATEEPHLVCHDDTLAAVEALHTAGYTLGCVTNTLADAPAIRSMLRRHGFEPLMNTVVVSAEEGWRKPHPSLFEKALHELGVAPPEAVFVGDSPFHDVGGAQAVGMRAVLTRQYVARPTDGLPEADAVIKHLRELLSLLEAW